MMDLKINNVSFSYGEMEVLKNISFQAARCEVVAILGENGSGKTTLLKTINKLLKPKCGTVLVDSQPVSKMNRMAVARIMGYLPQQNGAVNCSVFDAVLLGRKPHLRWGVKNTDIEFVEQLLKEMQLESLAWRKTTELSGGEFQKVMISRALAQEPKILLLDEPVNHLDAKNQLDVMSIIRKITKQRKIITLVVLHDINNAIRFADRFLMLKNGCVMAQGGQEIITPHIIEQLYGLGVWVIHKDGIPLVIPKGNWDAEGARSGNIAVSN